MKTFIEKYPFYNASELEIVKTIHEKLNGKKCLYIYGKNGCGKTFMIKNILKYRNDNHNMPISYLSVDEIILSLIKGHDLLQKEIDSPLKKDLIIDEFGSELESSAMTYGNPVKEIIYRHLMMRYELFTNNAKKIHLITNIYPEKLLNLYGNRLTDRFLEIFDFIEINWQNRRK